MLQISCIERAVSSMDADDRAEVSAACQSCPSAELSNHLQWTLVSMQEAAVLSPGDATLPDAAETGPSDAPSAEDPTAAASSDFAAVPAATGADLQQKHSNLVTPSSAGSSYTVSDFPSRQTSPGGPWADSRPLGDSQPAEPLQVWLQHVLIADMPSFSLVRHSQAAEANCEMRQAVDKHHQ